MLLPADATQFLALYGALRFYANHQLQVFPGVTSRAALEQRPLEDTITLRDALFDHPALIETFVDENPDHLGADELKLVASWAHFVRGNFFLVRYLKRYAVFIDSGTPARAYGVLGLTQPIQSLCPPEVLPVYLETILLPFKGQIAYDGLARSSALTFGPGIRRDLAETYRTIRENEGVVESLEPAPVVWQAPAPGGQTGKRPKPERSAEAMLTVLDRIQQDAERLRGAASPLESRAFSMLRAAAALTRAVVAEPDDLEALARYTRRAGTSLTQLAKTVDRARWRD